MKEKRHDRSSVTLLTEHLVITTKYRGKVLTGQVAVECEKTIREVCKELDIELMEIAVEKEHVHLLLQHPPKLSMSKIVEKVKSLSSGRLRRQFPHLKKWCSKALWSRGYHAVSIGHDHRAVMRYIRRQGTNHASSGRTGNVGQLPNMVGLPDDTSEKEDW